MILQESSQEKLCFLWRHLCLEPKNRQNKQLDFVEALFYFSVLAKLSRGLRIKKGQRNSKKWSHWGCGQKTTTEDFKKGVSQRGLGKNTATEDPSDAWGPKAANKGLKKGFASGFKD